MKTNIIIREATPQEYPLIAKHFYQLWRDNNIPPELIKENYPEITLEFIENAREKLNFCAFVAQIENTKSEIVGSASCQLYDGLYPHILSETVRKYGYIWGVYVEPAYRKQGIGKQLAQKAIAYLKSLNCTRAVLNASPSGKPVYTNLGFVESNAMWIDL